MKLEKLGNGRQRFGCYSAVPEKQPWCGATFCKNNVFEESECFFKENFTDFFSIDSIFRQIN